MLFILYLFIGTLYMCLTLKTLMHHHSFKHKDNKPTMDLLILLDPSLVLCMVIFNVWNWFLAFQGNTTIEFWTNFNGIDPNRAKLRFETISDNLFRVFGTHKFFRILSPSLRNVPFTGLEWSFWFRDSGYDCDGKKISR